MSLSRGTAAQPGGASRLRAQSSVLGVVLLLGIVVAGIGVITVIGGSALGETEERLSESRAEKVMTQFDSQSALVALGETNARQTDLVSGNGGSYTLDEDAGWMQISVTNTTSNATVNVTERVSIGAVTYRSQRAELAYQGGGVWKKDDGDAVMVSPPEFHYRGRTLTLPIINVSGDGSVGGRVTTRRDDVIQEYPDPAENESFVNPVPAEREVVVTVGSEYYRGWGTYFERRTDGNVSYDDGNQTASIRLTVPIEEEFDEAVTATGTVDGSSVTGDYTEGASRPSVTDEIDDRIDDCGGTSNISGSGATLDAGTYCEDGDFSFEGATFNTSDGDIDIVVNGTVTFKNSDTDINNATNNVTIYSKGLEVKGSTEVNEPGDPSALLTYVHSSVDEISLNGNAEYTGLIYAPNSDLRITGGGNAGDNILGSIVVEDYEGTGEPSNLKQAGGIARQLEFVDNAGITYLHISENRVEVEG